MPDLPLDLDLDRAGRCGLPETVYGPGKTEAEVVAAVTRLHAHHGRALATRCAPSALAALAAALPGGAALARSGTFLIGAPEATLGPVAVVSAGTADAPVVEECCATLAIAGVAARRFDDCGVAGLHRLQRHLDAIRSCRVAVVIAGMEGALPSVVGGLVDLPLIAVPTATGYGAAEEGRTALMAMLTSCAAGVTVVNIGNGFGAAVAAAAICRQISRA